MARLDELIGQFVNPEVREVIRAFADHALEDCALCNRKALPFPCKLCGIQTCHEHGFHKIAKRESICDLCLRDLMGEVAGVAEDSDFDHWDYLGYTGPTSKQLVERAFRIKSRTCHPDLFPDDPEKSKEWRMLQLARERALEELEAQGS